MTKTLSTNRWLRTMAQLWLIVLAVGLSPSAFSQPYDTNGTLLPNATSMGTNGQGFGSPALCQMIVGWSGSMTFSSPTPFTVYPNVFFTGSSSYSYVRYVQYSIDGGSRISLFDNPNGNWGGWDAEYNEWRIFTLTLTPQPGTHSVTVYAANGYTGGEAACTFSYTYNANTAPTVAWHTLPPSPLYRDTWFPVRATGSDSDGNLGGVWVEYSVNGGAWQALAYDPAGANGGNGYETTSNNNSILAGTPGTTYQFRCYAWDQADANSGWQYSSVYTVENRPPTAPAVSFSVNPIIFGQTTTVTFSATDPDGNLIANAALQSPAGTGGGDYRRPPGVDYSAIGWNGYSTDLNNWSNLNFSSSASSSGSSDSKTFTIQPVIATSTYLITTYSKDAYGTYVGSWNNINVNKATPSGSFANRTLNGSTGSYTVQAGDLNAAFSNPYSGAVAAPTGAISYSIVGPGTAVTAGTVLSSDQTYTIRASYPGDGNYNPSTKDATWTVSSATYTLTVENGTGGGSGFPSGTIRSIAANSPPTGHLFSNWTLEAGPGSIADSNSSSTTFTMGAGNATVRANFVLDPNGDFDSDGMRNDWESAHGFDPQDPADALQDADGDGLTNVAEYNLDLDPSIYDFGTSTLGNTVPAGWSALVSGDTSTAVGTTAGSLSVDKSGAATYSVPIWVTPGTSGLEPQLSLNYSSQGGPGILGYGWSLGGVSSISRGPQTHAVDGQVVGVKFAASDRFYLDGQRLILVGGTYGADGSEYRTELESFTKVVAYGARGTGPEKFKAWTKAGLIIEFGYTADSAFDAYGRAEAFSWHVNRISDTSGNYMTFTYEEDAANGVHRLTRIDYTGNGSVQPYAHVDFEYEDRSDKIQGYLAGSPISSLKRLKHIRSYHDVTVARTYTLAYSERPENGRSILTSLTEAGTDGKAYPPLTFVYQDNVLGWTDLSTFELPVLLADNEANSGQGYPTGTGTGFVDLNGDGLTDFVHKRDSVGASYLNTGTGWTAASGYLLPHPLAAWVSSTTDTGARFADVNSDGLPDFIYRKHGSDGTLQQNNAWINTGSGWQESIGWRVPAPTARDGTQDDHPLRGGKFVDVNGDGRVDFIAHFSFSATPVNLAVYLNTGSGWSYNAGYSSMGSNVAKYKARFVDLNGDGLPDIACYFSSTSGTLQKSWLNTGSGWTESISYRLPQPIADDVNPTLGAEFADINGDGLPDLIWSREMGSTFDSGAAINTGTGWLQNATIEAQYTPPSTLGIDGEHTSGAAVVDLNADGMPDIALSRQIDPHPAAKATHYGDLRQWAASTPPAHDLEPLLMESGVKYIGVDFVDLDGDGAVDVVWNRKNSDSTFLTGARVNLSRPHDMLVEVTNGLGVTAEIAYKPLTDPTVYSKGTGATYPQTDVIAPAYVVSQVRHEDGAGGTYDLNYAYGGLRSDALRGNVGFEWMSVRDTRTDIVSTTEFSQEFPFIGMPVESYTRRDGGTGSLLSESSTIYDVKPLNSGATQFVFAKQTIQKSYELNGTLVSESTTTTQDGVLGTHDRYDAYGNSLWIEVDTSDGFKKTTVNVYGADNIAAWHLGRLTRSTVTSVAPGRPTLTRVSSFIYNATTGLLESETVEPDLASDPKNLTLTTTYGYDAFGNKTSATVTGGGLGTGRTTTTAYDSQGRFPISSTNALGHTETYTHHALLGTRTSLEGPNELTTSWQYDGFGRQTKETRADGTVTDTRYRWAGGGAPSGAAYSIETESTGSPPAAAFHDAFGRAVYQYGLNGGGVDGNIRIVGTRTEFDAMGRAFRSSLPFFVGDPINTATETTSFDLLNRPLAVNTADDTVVGGFVTSTIVYDGFTTRATNPKGQRTDTTKNKQGQVVSVVTNATAQTTDPDYGMVQYAYDAVGNLIETHTRKSDGTWIGTILQYDVRGRKTQMVDPDMGTWTYGYNAAGELVSQTDAKSQTTTMAYDKLGRMTSRVEPEGTTTWTYDTASRGSGLYWLGRLHQVSGPTDRAKIYSETHAYDALGRPSSVSRVIDGETFTTAQAYDSVGRPTVTTYPTGFQSRNVYNNLGFLKEVRAAGGRLPSFAGEVVADHVFWQADRYSIWGQVDGSTLGNGLTYDRVVSAVTGRVGAITAGAGQTTHVQFHQYTYDTIGNVTQRIDNAVNREESFQYDGLNRLTSHAVVAGATVTVAYDALGNITNKSDVGAYTYGGPRPHAVTAAGANSYSYDLNGNMTAGAGRTIEWTSYNQLRKVTQGGVNSEFWFGAGRERVFQQHSNGTKTSYIGGLFEKVEHPGGLIERKHYVMTPLGRTAVRVERNDATVQTRYFHQDGLGSIAAVTDEAGRVEKRYTFDAWGQRVETVNTYGGSGNTITRGYTDHEHLADFGLIHMNGRVYDPVLGRFLSADPFVDDAGDSQSFNRYSYVSNNPLNHTDPSGFFKLKDLVKIVAVVAIAYFTGGWGANVIGGWLNSAFAITSTAGTAITAGIGGGLAAGFSSGFAGSLLNGGSVGDAFQAGVVGGLVGAVTGGILGKIGTTDWGPIRRGFAHGATHGAASEVQGGEFRHGFYGGFLNGSLDGQIETTFKDSETVQYAAAAAAGGTGSVIGGGKFANGAVSGAFSYMFNQQGGASNWWKNKASGWVHGILDFAGFVPLVGEVADGINAGIYALEGDYTNASISAAAMIPLVGSVGTGARLGLKSANLVVDAAKNTATKQLTVIGHAPDYIKVAEAKGANYLKWSADWNFQKQGEFIKSVTQRGDDVLIGTPIRPGSSVLRREIKQFIKAGYEPAEQGSMLLIKKTN